MDGKKGSGGGVGDSFFVAMSKGELLEVKRWERMFDEDSDTTEGLFLRMLMRAARAGYRLQDETDRPFEPRQQPPADKPGSPLQQPPADKLGSPLQQPPADKLGSSLQQPPAGKLGSPLQLPPPPQIEFSRITVLALCAPAPPKNRARKPPAARAPQAKRPRCASTAPRGGAGKKGPGLDHPHALSLVQPRQPSTTSKPGQAQARPQNSSGTVTAPCAPLHPAREAEWAPSSSTAGFPQGKIGAS